MQKQNQVQWTYRARSRRGHRVTALVENAMLPSIINGPIPQQADTPAGSQFGISPQSQSVPFGTVFIRSQQVFERHHGNWVCISSQHNVLREDSNTSLRSSPISQQDTAKIQKNARDRGRFPHQQSSRWSSRRSPFVILIPQYPWI
jgi:hypothetical protein